MIHQFFHIVTAGADETLAVAMDFRDDVFGVHGSSDFNSSAGVQITGQS
jgi:hypothetical protein